MKKNCFRWAIASAFAFGLLTLSMSSTWAIPQSSPSLQQVTYDIKYLASDELGGRQPGTPGMEKAEAYIVEQFKKANVKPGGKDGSYFQPFSVGGERRLKKDGVTGAFVMGDEKVELKLGESLSPLAYRSSIELDDDIVFVGYSVKSTEHNYDEYADVDVNGKVVVMIRREPQLNNEDSVFDGTEMSSAGYIRTKLNNARVAGAKAVILVNDGASADTPEKDELVEFNQFGRSTLRIPTIQVSRAMLDKVLAKSPLLAGDGEKLSSLAEAEKLIDDKLSPLSQPIKGFKFQCNAEINREDIIANNVVAVIEGEGPNADETIVIGAHHDHLGMGDYGSRANRREIHNGADDNATGTAAVIELARRFQARDKKPGRTLVFVCFSAEEMGLLGARHYVSTDEPLFPLDKTVGMINFDMIGWLRDDKLTCFNWNTSGEFAKAVDAANAKHNLDLVKPRQGFAGSDHLPFNQKRIPNIFFHTGLTSTYHTPEDDFETINCEGAVKVIDYCEAFVDELCNSEKAPSYGMERRSSVSFGAILSQDDGKVVIESIKEGSIAAQAGFQVGDQILSVSGNEVKRRRQVVRALRNKAGETVTFIFKRGEAEKSVDVELKDE